MFLGDPSNKYRTHEQRERHIVTLNSLVSYDDEGRYFGAAAETEPIIVKRSVKPIAECQTLLKRA